MKKIDTLSSMEGRALLLEIYRELRYVRQLSNISVLLLCWKICVHDKEISKYINKDVSLSHILGFFSGTALWMEEIVNRYYFASINSFVYFGAAILLVLIGVRRFSQNLSDTAVIAGIAFEAFLLIIMFLVMLFTPTEELNGKANEEDTEPATVNELLYEIGEIGSDIANAVIQLEKISNNYNDMLKLQTELVSTLNTVSENAANAVAPNPKMIETMAETNEALKRLKSTVEDLTISAGALKKEQIELAVRREVERILINKLT